MAQMQTKQAQPGRIDVHRLMAALSSILSDKYDLDIKLTAIPKDAASTDVRNPASA